MGCIIKSTVSFEAQSHLVKDQFENSFIFEGTLTPTDTSLVADNMLQDFYNAPGATDPIGSFMSYAIDRSVPVTIKHYVLSATAGGPSVPVPAPGVGYGSPLRSSTFTLTAPTTLTALPSQIACALAYHGTLVGTSEHSGPGPRTAERRRGRIYIGPLNGPASVIDPSTHTAVVAAGLLTACRTSALGMIAQGNAAPGSLVFRLTGLPVLTVPDARAVWSIWSRVDHVIHQVAYGFVDNRFDTQRRRAETATFRNSWTGGDVA